MVAFEFLLDLNFVKKGKIELIYKKDTVKDKNNQISGHLEIFFNEER